MKRRKKAERFKDSAKRGCRSIPKSFLLLRIWFEGAEDLNTRPLQETAIALITTSKAAQSLGLHKHLTQVDVGSVWVIRKRRNRTQLGGWPGTWSGIGFVADVAEG